MLLILSLAERAVEKAVGLLEAPDRLDYPVLCYSETDYFCLVAL
jgi:hypothetical protein